jgi:cytochrome oxidase Cu insertion factor (SCO1/SenC/PrrC family)
MRKTISVVLLFLLLGVCGVIARPAAAQAKKAPEPLTLKVGDTAPDFSLLEFDGKDVKKVSLSDFRGKKNVALAFYVFAFTGG